MIHAKKEPKEPKDLQEERTLEGMRMVRTGRGCYLCYSTSRPDVAYAVDVSANEGLGSCNCEDFLYRRLPRWKEVKKAYPSFRCRHIRRCRDHILDQIIQHYKDKP